MTTESISPFSIASPQLNAGQKLAGCYQLARSLDVGGGPPIWLAQDEVLGKQVSLHFLPNSVANDSAAIEALRQEIKRNRPLIHPGVLRVYDLVEGEGWAAVAMDAFEGRCLAAILKEKGRFEVAEIEPWLDEICVTLEEAHRIKLTHRDLAPENIFVAKDGRLLLANFGISRVIQESLRKTGGKAAPAARLYTCSPQLLAGESPSVSDDVYGVGTLLFELLTGYAVFAGDDVAEQIQRATPPRVSEVRDESDECGGAVPPGWENVVAACLNKAADERPHRPSEIVSSIEAYLPLVETPEADESDVPATESAVAAVPLLDTNEEEDLGAAAKTLEILPAEREAEVLVEAPESAADDLPASTEVPVPLQAKEESAPAESKAETVAPISKPDPKPVRKVPVPYEREQSLFSQLRFPAAVIAAVMLILFLLNSFFKTPKDSLSPAPAIVTTDPADRAELTSVKNSVREPSTAPRNVAPEPTKAPMPPQPKAVQNAPEPAMVVAAGPTPKAPTVAPLSATPATPLDKEIAEKAAALDRLKQELAAAEKTQQARLKEQQSADTAVAEAKSAIEAKRKAAEAAKKVTDNLLAARKKRQEEQKTADLAAQAAQQLAADKARAAEEARKALADFETQNRDKFAAQDRSDAEIAALERKLAEQQKIVDEGARAAAALDTAKQQQLAAIRQGEQDLVQARSSIAQAAAEESRRRQSMDAERKKLDDEIAAMRALFEQKMKDIEDRRRQIEGAPPSAAATPPSPVAPQAMAPTRTETLSQPPATPVPPLPLMAARTETPKAVPPLTPEPRVAPPVTASAATNSLGMRFAPVGDVLFCVWQTRVKDFEAFANATKLKSTAWRGPGFRQGPDHPVVNVTWNEAIAFCKWLTDKEHKEGSLPAAQFYRLPYDPEWSKAVALPDETGKTPEARDMGVPDVYPWGTDWPPPKGAGNYTGEETGSDVAIKGYDDGFAWTAPVGSFPANKFGLYDMGGNVWQWCMDSWNNQSKAKVLRGASWYNGALKLSLLSSCRVHAAPDSSTDNYGFRVVLATEAVAPKAARK